MSRGVRAAAAVLVLGVLLPGCASISISKTPPQLELEAEDAVGSLSDPSPPVLRVRVLREGEPVQGLEVRFSGLDEDGDELGGLGFATTDAQGIAVTPAAQPEGTTLEQTLFEATHYQAAAVTEGGEASGRDRARLDVRR